MTKKHLFTVLSAGLFVGISFFATPLVPHAQAAGFTVDSLGDGSDSNQGNGLCDDGSGNCTLRAAIQEVNALGGSGHTIGFASGGVITLSIQLPTIMAGVTIDGTTVAGASCDMNSRNLPVEIDLSSFHNPFVVNASSVTIKGLTMYHVNDSSTLVFYSGSSDGFVLCNNINTDTLGSQVAAVPSHINSQGISADRVDRLTIGLPGEGNVIGGSSTPISISNSSVVKLFGNVLGLNAKTDAALNPSVQQTGATFNGTSDITIGGPNPGEGNVISGMQEPSANSQGLSFDSSSDIVIQGNYIGTNNDGTVEFGNAAQGIEICGGAILCNGAGAGVSNITIGGPNPGEGNVISGNGIMSNGEGILAADATGVFILNNLIGTKAGGDEALPNENGINIQGGSNISILDNVISGNSSNGVAFSEGVNPLSNLTFLRNKIGVGLDGTTALGNKTGVALFGPSTLPLEIGSTTLVDANSIVNNTDYGMLVLSLSSDMQIKYNYIGVLSSGAAAPNGLGIVIVNTPFGHLTITKNLIKNNLGDGIVIFDSPLVGPFLPAASTNTIIDNVITGNGGLGIELADDQVPDLSFPVPDTNVGPNLNDLGDTDAGVNDYLNYPVINKVVETTPGNLDISYYLDVPAGTYRVELYKNPTNGLDPSFHGEGESLVYVDTVTTAGGMINRHVPVAVPGTVADVVTATATEDLGAGVYGKTSEFGTTVPGTGSGTAAGIDTGNTSILAPANGAYHLLGTNYLGSCVNADNDNATSIPGVFVGTGPCANDNDGLTLAAYYDAGDAVVLAPTMSAPGIINVWIDYNNNGDYLDLGEHVISQNTAGVIPPFVVPPANFQR
jgi:CSLREA domain-containing protein